MRRSGGFITILMLIGIRRRFCRRDCIWRSIVRRIRFDLRPFLYPRMAGSWPVEKIEEHVGMLEVKEKQQKEGGTEVNGTT